jgi:hypothetical protein
MAALGFSGSLPPGTDRQESLWGVDEGSEDVEHVRFFRLNPIVAGVILTARQHQGNVGGHTLPRFLFAARSSRFDFGGELLQVSRVAAQLLRQPGHDRLGWGHLAVDHLEQLHRIDVQLRPELVDIGVPGHA